jgi:hypothetical protein
MIRSRRGRQVNRNRGVVGTGLADEKRIPYDWAGLEDVLPELRAHQLARLKKHIRAEVWMGYAQLPEVRGKPTRRPVAAIEVATHRAASELLTVLESAAHRSAEAERTSLSRFYAEYCIPDRAEGIDFPEYAYFDLRDALERLVVLCARPPRRLTCPSARSNAGARPAPARGS